VSFGDDFVAPGEHNWPPPDKGMERAILTLAQAINALAESNSQLAASNRAPTAILTVPPGAPMPPVAGGPPAAKGGDKTREQKMGAKVFAICKQNDWDIASVAAQITGHPMAADSRTWTAVDLGKVLDQFSEWGFG
jgi:hypothetical protein